MKKLYFMRHGLSQMNVQSLTAGHTETPLTDEGRRQAQTAGQGAKDLGIDLIVSSPLSRTLETAQLVAQEIGYPTEKIIINPLLVERFFGDWEGKPWPVPADRHTIAHYEHDEPLIARAHQALDWINSLRGNHILVVSHSAFGRALRSVLKEEFPINHPERINNAEILCWVEET